MLIFAKRESKLSAKDRDSALQKKSNAYPGTYVVLGGHVRGGLESGGRGARGGDAPNTKPDQFVTANDFSNNVSRRNVRTKTKGLKGTRHTDEGTVSRA